jgi:hypothetical protein
MATKRKGSGLAGPKTNGPVIGEAKKSRPKKGYKLGGGPKSGGSVSGRAPSGKKKT